MSLPAPPILCIVGRKNAGKTGLIVALAAELNRRGHKVMTVKHGHGFQLDQPGKDSWRHRHEGGAHRTVMAGPTDFAVVGRWPGEEMGLAELVARFLWDAEIVLAEGFKSSPELRIEIFRPGAPDDPGLLYDKGDPSDSRTLAVVTDAPDLELPIPVFRLQDPEAVPALANLVTGVFQLLGSGR